jgi:photosystem II stability/assembly factor-like uncharacterized protein
MSNPLDANEIVKQSNARSFYQPGGPGTKSYFFGVDTLYHYIEAANKPTANGSIEPIFVPDPRRPGLYKLAGRTVSAPELPTMTINWSMQWGGIPRPLLAPGCEFNVITVYGRCSDLSDLYRGWDSMAMIFSGMKFSGNMALGAQTAMNTDEALMIGTEATGVAIYPVGALSFGEEATTDVLSQVVSVVYGTDVQCNNCGNANDGSQFIYALTRNNVASPSSPAQLIYSLDGGASWSVSKITGIGSTAEPRYVRIAGNILFVGTNLATMFYTTLNTETGAPTTWNSVTQLTHFEDAYVQSPTNIWFVNGTSVYKTSDISVAAVEIDDGGVNLFRIHGANKTIVAVGNAGEVRFSINNGVTWLTGIAPAATNLRAISVVDDRNWFTGGANGQLYKTTDRGSNWQTSAIPGAGTGSISAIVSATREVIWVARNNVSAFLVTTIDGGYTWIDNTSGSARILNWPTFGSISCLAVPTTVSADVSANYVTVGGLATGGADGVLITAAPTIL